jgi:predicted phosphoribosyltransferase
MIRPSDRVIKTPEQKPEKAPEKGGGFMMKFKNRSEAGRFLSERLSAYADRRDTIVLALPRGGVPIGFEVATALHAPLDIFLVRKLGVPGQVELAMGAIATGGVRALNQDVIQYLGVPDELIDEVTAREQKELERRELLYRGGRPAQSAHGRVAILVDDGLATGSTMRAAATALRRQQPAKIVVAVPVGSEQVCNEFRYEMDEIVCGYTPEPFYAISLWYEDFSQTTDDEVSELLLRAEQRLASAARK